MRSLSKDFLPAVMVAGSALLAACSPPPSQDVYNILRWKCASGTETASHSLTLEKGEAMLILANSLLNHPKISVDGQGDVSVKASRSKLLPDGSIAIMVPDDFLRSDGAKIIMKREIQSDGSVRFTFSSTCNNHELPRY